MKMLTTLVAISGFSSEVGKTTLLCRLLQALRGWEAIKMTRGHYRSCGKAPGACCVSHLLGDEPVIRSGYEQTYSCGKDTGRYWDAGASNVHWVIVTDRQVEQGLKLALDRVAAPGVLIEGNSFLKFIDVDFTIVVARGSEDKMKPSTRWALKKASALYLFDESDEVVGPSLVGLRQQFAPVGLTNSLPVYTCNEFPQLITRIRQITTAAVPAG